MLHSMAGRSCPVRWLQSQALGRGPPSWSGHGARPTTDGWGRVSWSGSWWIQQEGQSSSSYSPLRQTSGPGLVGTTPPSPQSWYGSEHRSLLPQSSSWIRWRGLRQALKSGEKWLESRNDREGGRGEVLPDHSEACLCWRMGLCDRLRVQIPALPPRRPTRRTRKVPRSLRTSTAKRVSWKRKQSASCDPSGVKRPASCRTETRDVKDRKEQERSRRQYREWPRRSLVSRRRSESRPPSAARVHRDEFEHQSLHKRRSSTCDVRPEDKAWSTPSRPVRSLTMGRQILMPRSTIKHWT